MRIGTSINTTQSVLGITEEIRARKDEGFQSVWASQIFGPDALTALAVAGAQVPDIELGTAVVPVYPRHPMMLAQQALTVQSATANRLTLGIGLSHQVVVENCWGFSYDRPGRYMREYLEALMALVTTKESALHGEVLTSQTFGPLDFGDVPAPSVLVAALAPMMLKLAGRVADGTALWMTGEKTIATHIAPIITEAAAAAGRGAPRIAAALPVCVTDDVTRAAQEIDAEFAIYPSLPSYRAVMDIEGASSASDIALIGSEAQVLDALGRIAAAGATDFAASVCGNRDERAATRALLASAVASL